MGEDSELGKPNRMDLSFSDFVAILSQPKGTAPPAPEVAVASTKDDCEELKEKKWLFEQRLEYARYFFDHHAKQRMSMFNYFLIFAGFIVTGYATLIRASSFGISAFLALAGAVLTVFFVFLERRNEELVHITEDVLQHLEEDVLFDGFDRWIMWPRRRTYLGKLQETRQFRKLGIFRRQAQDQKCPPEGDRKSRYEHGKWMPRFQYCIFWMFVGMAVSAAWLIISPWLVRHSILCAAGSGK